MVVTLIGYRGSGKSSVAAGLANHLHFEWIDADAEIETEAGETIREIFAREGEPGFRQRERKVISQLKRDRLVLAAGGGAVLNADSRREMRSAGPVVWLKAGVDVLFGRIYADPATAARRPNLAGGGKEEIARLLTDREPLYRACATIEVETDQLAISEIVDQIVAEINKLPATGGAA